MAVCRLPSPHGDMGIIKWHYGSIVVPSASYQLLCSVLSFFTVTCKQASFLYNTYPFMHHLFWEAISGHSCSMTAKTLRYTMTLGTAFLQNQSGGHFCRHICIAVPEIHLQHRLHSSGTIFSEIRPRQTHKRPVCVTDRGVGH